MNIDTVLEKALGIVGTESMHMSELTERKRDATHVYYDCPWCTGHFATISKDCQEIMKPLHCHISGRMVWVDTRMGHVIKRVIRDEESAFFELLAGFEDLGDLSAKEAYTLHTSRGCPLEIAEDHCNDIPGLYILLAEHRAKSNTKARTI